MFLNWPNTPFPTRCFRHQKQSALGENSSNMHKNSGKSMWFVVLVYSLTCACIYTCVAYQNTCAQSDVGTNLPCCIHAKIPATCIKIRESRCGSSCWSTAWHVPIFIHALHIKIHAPKAIWAQTCKQLAHTCMLALNFATCIKAEQPGTVTVRDGLIFPQPTSIHRCICGHSLTRFLFCFYQLVTTLGKCASISHLYRWMWL